MNRKYKIWGVFLAIVLVLMFSVNFILNNVVSNIVANQIEKINKEGEVTLQVGKIRINVFTGSLKISEISIKPDSLYFEGFKDGKTNKPSTSMFYMSDLKIRGFSIYNVLVNEEIIANKIIANGLSMTLFKSGNEKKEKGNKNKEAEKVDSIFIKGFQKIEFKSIVFDDFDFKIIDVHSTDTLFEYKEKEMEILGFRLDAQPEVDNYFKMYKDDLKINFKEQEIDTKGGNYKIIFKDLKYSYSTSSILISNFSLKPTKDKAELASTFPYNSEVFNVQTNEICLKGFHLDSIILTGIIAIDSVVVDGLDLGIYKDQRKPFNLNKRPLFLNQTFKRMKDPLHIGTVIVKNSKFKYLEKHENMEGLMTVDFSDLNAEIKFITSIKDSLDSGKDLTVNVKANLSNVAPINLDIFMHYKTWNDSYSYSGSVGKANFTAFNPAIYPATGMKFEAGVLNSIQFKVHGTPKGTTGEMSMLYSGLKATLIKEKKVKKGLSWIANSVLIKSNPNPKGKLFLALVETERVAYKGFGNVLWKSVQSGLMNTIIPAGKQATSAKIKKQQIREASKEDKKEKRKKKREEDKKEVAF